MDQLSALWTQSNLDQFSEGASKIVNSVKSIQSIWSNNDAQQSVEQKQAGAEALIQGNSSFSILDNMNLIYAGAAVLGVYLLTRKKAK